MIPERGWRRAIAVIPDRALREVIRNPFLTAAFVALAWTVLPDCARAACTPEELRQLQAGNATERQIRQLCADRPATEIQLPPSVGPDDVAAAQRAPRGRSDRCYTPALNCILMEYQRTGSQCWCVTPFGPSYGTAR